MELVTSLHAFRDVNVKFCAVMYDRDYVARRTAIRHFHHHHGCGRSQGRGRGRGRSRSRGQSQSRSRSRSQSRSRSRSRSQNTYVCFSCRGNIAFQFLRSRQSDSLLFSHTSRLLRCHLGRCSSLVLSNLLGSLLPRRQTDTLLLLLLRLRNRHRSRSNHTRQRVSTLRPTCLLPRCHSSRHPRRLSIPGHIRFDLNIERFASLHAVRDLDFKSLPFPLDLQCVARCDTIGARHLDSLCLHRSFHRGCHLRGVAVVVIIVLFACHFFFLLLKLPHTAVMPLATAPALPRSRVI